MRLREFTNDTVANWKTIAARNNLANPDLILPGQELDVGDGIVLPKGTTYVVKPGDTLSGIAKNIRQGWRPDAGSSATIEPTNPDSTTMGNAIAAAGGQSGASAPDSTTMGNAIASAGGSKSSQTKSAGSDPSKYAGGIAKRSAPKQSTSTPVTKPPVINLPNVDPPEVKRGRPTMPADRNQTPPPAVKTKPSLPDYHDPAYDGPSDEAPVDDADIKKRIGADQPIPGYKYDAAKDKAISDRLEKQDRERQKQLQKQPGGGQGISKPNKAPKPGGNKTSSSEFDKIRGIESGNRDYDDYGRPIVSPKGARYAAQVMPATNTDPGYGVKPAANTGPDESNRVGRDYFNAMKNKYGNSELAAAAYNAGPGRIDKILQKARETGRHWKDFLPAETQNYIKKFTGK